MARALTMRRARVSPRDLPGYLSAVSRAAAARRDAGQHLWLFRHSSQPDIFVEFREGPEAATLGPSADEEGLARFASYAEDAEVLIEVRPDAAPPGDPR